MKLKPSSGGGDGKPFEVPPDDNHKAAIVGVVFVGTHLKSYKEGDEPKPVPLVVLAYELLETKKEDGNRFVVGEQYRFSLDETSALRKIVEAAMGDKLEEEKEFDFNDLLGRSLRVSITHDTKKGTDGKERTYANIAAITKADKKDQGKAKTEFAPYLYSPEELDAGEEYVVHDWMPFTYHHAARKRLPPEKIIALCEERNRPAKAANGAGKPAGAGVAVD